MEAEGRRSSHAELNAEFQPWACWIRILNFYVDGFGEWQIGSEEPVKSATTQRVPLG